MRVKCATVYAVVGASQWVPTREVLDSARGTPGGGPSKFTLEGTAPVIYALKSNDCWRLRLLRPCGTHEHQRGHLRARRMREQHNPSGPIHHPDPTLRLRNRGRLRVHVGPGHLCAFCFCRQPLTALLTYPVSSNYATLSTTRASGETANDRVGEARLPSGTRRRLPHCDHTVRIPPGLPTALPIFDEARAL